MVRNDIRVTFMTNLSNRQSFSIPRANPLASSSLVAGAMDGIITTGIVSTAAGSPQARYRAELITTESTVFDFNA